MEVARGTSATATTGTSEVALTPREATWERVLRNVVVFIARIALAYLFFANLWWKLPPDFGCPKDFTFKEETTPGQYTKSSGLCTYLGYESIFARKPREVLVADLQYARLPHIGVNIQPLAQINGAIVDNIIKPNIRVAGYVIWLAEAFIFVTMLLGLVTRLGGLVALGVSAQLMIGLANAPLPGDFEWEWGYNLMVVLSLMMIGLTPGRIFGLDALIRRWAVPAAARGSLLGKLFKVLT
jgi:hypothetical protein